MKVIRAYPPNFSQIAKVFPVKGRPGILYAYGDRIYNPSGVEITPWIMAHEEVHGNRQLGVTVHTNSSLEDWWCHYLTDPKFRLNEELLAHQAEWRSYTHVMQATGEGTKEGYLALIAGRLASPLYGSLVTKAEAARLILEE